MTFEACELLSQALFLDVEYGTKDTCNALENTKATAVLLTFKLEALF